MADRTSIEWTDATWTPVKGCTRKSPGCVNCYAEIMAARFSKPGQWGEGLATIVETPHGKDHRWTGAVRLDSKELLKPLSWRKPRRIFVCSTSDLFHEAVSDDDLDLVFAVMGRADQHTYQVLTKRPERMRDYIKSRTRLPDEIGAFYDLPTDGSAPIYQPLRNVWLGVSVEDQSRATERISVLQDVPAHTRFVSFEPLLGPVNADLRGVHWAIVGGESGPGARPMHPDWARSLRDQCAAAGVPFLFKQWGEHLTIFDRDVEDPDWRNCARWEHAHPKGRWWNLAGGTGFHGDRVVYVDRVGKKAAGRLLDGKQHDAFPETAHG